MDKETIAKILAYVEKNCTEVEEVEEYLWKLLDKSQEDSRMKRQWLDINGSIEVDVDEDTFNVEFLKWLESKGWIFAGVIMEGEYTEL